MKWIPRFLKSRTAGDTGNQADVVTVWEALAEELYGGSPADPEVQRALEEERKRPAGPESECGPPGTITARKAIIPRLHEAARSALCFSGGGIRSATFGLGILQGLAAHSCSRRKPDAPRLLGDLDYLSTVSGGGYLGGWFSAWATRAQGGVTEVIHDLASPPDVDWEPEPEPLCQLRKFANYLNPRLGLFSADTWTLVATIIRNLLLNWLVLLPLIAGILTLPRILYKLVQDVPDGSFGYLLTASAVLLVLPIAYMVVDLPSAGNARLSQRSFLWFGLGPLVLSAIGFVLYWAWAGYLETEPTTTGFVFYGIAIMAAGVALGTFYGLYRHRVVRLQWILKGGGFAVAVGALGGLFTCWMTWAFTNPADDSLYSYRVYAWLSVPALLGVFALSQGVLVGLTSAITGDEDREWFSRANAWILIVLVGCLGFSGVALMPPVLARWLPSLHLQALLTALTGALASRAGYSPVIAATEEKGAQQSSAGTGLWTRVALALLKPAFPALLLALLATFNEAASKQLTAWLVVPPLWSPLRPIAQPDPAMVECLLAAVLVLPALLLSRVIDANKFSLHAMYRSRLIRTFLGASHKGRKPNPFTGFDPGDNLMLRQLPERPLHVINSTLNLVKGQNLAWQERKGESFTGTRYRVGSCRIGYQSTRDYAAGVTLGGAVAISGAAANPNMGYSSSPLLSIIMMLFNARLGAWLPNPGPAGKAKWRQSGPTFSVQPFVDEAFGLTTDTNKWINLSDGGHFDNLGLYEMVLRRCANIVVVDGSADPSFHFDDLGNAIRKIFVDMGITIEFPDGLPISRTPGVNSRHAAVGTIRYSAVDGDDAPDGTLIYIKSSLTGNEPEDVRNYAAQHPSFPHQSTSDQWFNESQFEAYRRLGYHVVEEIFSFQDDIVSLSRFCDRVKHYCRLSQAGASAAN